MPDSTSISFASLGAFDPSGPPLRPPEGSKPASVRRSADTRTNTFPQLETSARPTWRRRWLAHTQWTALCLASALGCQPEGQSLTTDRMEISTDFAAEVCEGTLNALDDHVLFVESSTGRRLPPGQRIAWYWITQSLDEWCSERAYACYFPGTRIVAGGANSINHEIVHAVLDAEAETNIFIEEALAEVLSGRGVAHNPRVSSRRKPAELLWLSRREYLRGDLDYRVATHFLHYIRSRRPSIGALETLATVVVEGSDAARVELAFSDLMGKSFAEVHDDYMASSRVRYAGIHESQTPVARLPSTLNVRLDCRETNTYGPRRNAAPGMYHVRRLELERSEHLRLSVSGHEGGWVDVLPARSQAHSSLVLDYQRPNANSRVDTMRIPVGWQVDDLWLARGEYLLVFSRGDYATSELSLDIEVLDPNDDVEIGPRAAVAAHTPH